MTNPPKSPSMPQSDIRALKEKLAAIEHERWADWQRWVHDQFKPHTNNAGEKFFIIPAYKVDAWNTQIRTHYDDLTDREKASDMEQVDRYWPLIEEYITNHTNAAVEENTIQLLQDFQPGKHTDPEHLATLMQEEIMRASDRLAKYKDKDLL